MTDRLFDLTDRVVIVTGATSGLGARFTELLLARGARVAAFGRNTDTLNTLRATYAGDRLLVIRHDVRDHVATADHVARVASWGGRIDGLVTAAGATNFVPAEEESVEDFARVVDINLTGTYAFCHHVGRRMLGQGAGSIVTISSINGVVASHGEAGYVATKTGVIGLTRELAAQWASRSVRVNAICPGYFPSAMTAHLYETEEGMARISRSPMGRPGRRDELDGTLVHLLSDASSFMTGQAIVVDGGLTIV